MENYGFYPETFVVTLKANTITIGNQTVVNLAPGTTKILTFTWDIGFVLGDYWITATASAVSGETKTSDNTYTTAKFMSPQAEPSAGSILFTLVSNECFVLTVLKCSIKYYIVVSSIGETWMILSRKWMFILCMATKKKLNIKKFYSTFAMIKITPMARTMMLRNAKNPV